MTKQGGSVLNKVDYDEIDKRVRDTIDEKISNLPTKKEYFDTMDELMKEIKAARSDLAAHGMSHDHINEDNSRLKQQVKHIFKTFEINDPTEVVPTY